MKQQYHGSSIERLLCNGTAALFIRCAIMRVYRKEFTQIEMQLIHKLGTCISGKKFIYRKSLRPRLSMYLYALFS